MPEMTPLGDKGASLSSGFDTLNSILGLQQKKQQLDIQAQQLQQQKLQTQQQSAYQGFFNSWDPFDHLGADGTTDTDAVKASPAYQNAGPARDAIDQKLLAIKQSQLQNKSSLLSLNKDQLSTAASLVGGLGSDPDVQAGTPAGRDKVKATIAGMGQTFGAGAQGMANTFLPLVDKAKPQDLAKAVRGFQLQALSTQQQLEQQNPQLTTNAAGQLLNRDKGTGALTAPGMGGGAINPSSPQVAGATQTVTGTAADDNKRNADISNSVAPSRSAIALADQVSNLADQVQTGKFSKLVNDYAATIGQNDPKIAARQLITKYAAQLKTLATENAPSNTARDQISGGFPDPENMTPAAIKGASEYIKGGMLMNLSRAANARNFTATHAGTQGLRNADDQLTSNADPLMYTYQNLPKGAARTEFIQRHFSSAADAQDFVRRKNAVEHYGGFNQ